jgi:isochorismate synthase
LSNEHEQGFIFNSFLGDQILFVEKLEPISADKFELHFSENQSIDQSRENYADHFKKIKAEIENGICKKIILSRTKKIQTNSDALTIFSNLNAAYKNTFNYVISNSSIGTWMGATPESLLTIQDKTIFTMSLAGTKLPEATWTEKEFEEQQLVTDTILTVLKENNCLNISSEGPTTINAGKIQHLQTSIHAELAEKADWTNLVNHLHPTPAVCGIPTQAAKNAIQTIESHQRQFYTGFLGILTPQSKSLYVNLRCMQYFKNEALLYIGGGITSASLDEAEWAETERKSQTLADAINA